MTSLYHIEQHRARLCSQLVKPDLIPPASVLKSSYGATNMAELEVSLRSENRRWAGLSPGRGGKTLRSVSPES